MGGLVRRGAIAAAAIAAALLAPVSGTAATSASWKGVVVAKDPSRHAVITASAGGVVRTVRNAPAARSLTLGLAITVRAQQLHDGTFRVQRITPVGRASAVQLRGVLIRYQGGRYLVSAGGSVLAVRGREARRTAAVSTAGVRPGDKVLMTTSIAHGALTATSVRTVGHTGSVELEGLFLGLTATGQIRLAVAHRGEVLVTVPAGVTLPALSPGDELELAVTVDSAGAFTLVRVGDTEVGTANEENADENDQGEDNNEQGEDNNEQGEDNNDQGDDNDDQGDDNDDQGDDGD
jgi:hypothetical protein